jgi:hypothetical protein
MCGVPVEALAALRGAKSACERWFRLQSASNSPKTHVSGTMRSVSRRSITVAVLRRAVRHRGAPVRRSRRSPTTTRCPKLVESTSGAYLRMVTAAVCGRVRASLEAPAASPSIDGPDGRLRPLDRCRELLGAPPGPQNSPFWPNTTPLSLAIAPMSPD